MMFGLLYIAITAAIAWRARSKAAIVALPALIGTVGLFWAGVADAAAYSSAMWTATGGFLIIQGFINGGIPENSEYVAGALYGMSGLVYVLFYLGFSNETISFVPVVSDALGIAGLIAGTWPNLIANIRRNRRRSFRGSAVQIARADLARSSMRCGLEG